MKAILLINFFELIDEWSIENIGISAVPLISLLLAVTVIVAIWIIIKKINDDPIQHNSTFSFLKRESVGGKDGKKFLIAKKPFIAIIRNEALIDEFFYCLEYKRQQNIFPYKISLYIRNDTLADKLKKELRKREVLGTKWVDILRNNKIIVEASDNYDFEDQTKKAKKINKKETSHVKKKGQTTIIPLFPNDSKFVQRPKPTGQKPAVTRQRIS